MRMKERVESWAQIIKSDLNIVYYAYKDPRVPIHIKLLGAAIVAYALSPIDLIPDFIPVIGYLDDLLIVPLGIKLMILLLPEDIKNEYREALEKEENEELPKSRAGAIAVIMIWGIVIILILRKILYG